MRASRPFDLCSVDVWDTLLRRACHPDAVKLHTANTLLLRCPGHLPPALRRPRALLRLRLDVERQLAHDAQCAGADDEYALHEVLAAWLARALPRGAGPVALDRLAHELEEEEWQHEHFVAYADPGIEAVLSGIPARQWVFLSDFYVPAERLAALLRAKGVERFGGGHASCEPRLNKRSGRLYRHVQALYAVAPARHCHVGDNAGSDVQVPRRLGMQAVRYANRAEERLRAQREAWFHDRPALYRAVQRHCRSLDYGGGGVPGEARRYGLQLAPLFAGFALFTLESARRDGVERLLFCTREGELFARVYTIVAQAYPRIGRSVPAAERLEVSRYATFTASLDHLSVRSMRRLWSSFDTQSLRAWALSLGLDEAMVAGWCRRHGLPFEQPVERPWRDARVRALLDDRDVQVEVRELAARRRWALASYLRSLGLPRTGRLGLVDIGWRGSIQDNLALLVPSVQWRGYYLGLQKFLNAQPGNGRKLAYGPDLNVSDEHAGLFRDLPLVEMLCSAPGGSVVGYAADGAGVQALRLADADEDAAFHGVVRHVQDGILAGAAIWADAIHQQALHSSELRAPALAAWAELVQSPPRFLARTRRRHKHNEMFGRGRFDAPEAAPSWLERLLRVGPKAPGAAATSPAAHPAARGTPPAPLPAPSPAPRDAGPGEPIAASGGRRGSR